MYKKIYFNEIILDITIHLDKKDIWKWKKKPILYGLLTCKKVYIF